MNRSLVVSAFLGVSILGAISSAPMIGVFNAKYSPKKDGNLAKAKCSLCHQKALPKLNPYGEEMKKELAGAKKLTPDVLGKLEGKDSDGDGVKNGVEIKADTLPGDKASK